MNLRVLYAVRNYYAKTDGFTNRDVFEVASPNDVEVFIASKESVNHIMFQLQDNLSHFEAMCLLGHINNLDIHAVTRDGEYDYGSHTNEHLYSSDKQEELLSKSMLLENLVGSPYENEIVWFVKHLREGFSVFVDIQKGIR